MLGNFSVRIPAVRLTLPAEFFEVFIFLVKCSNHSLESDCCKFLQHFLLLFVLCNRIYKIYRLACWACRQINYTWHKPVVDTPAMHEHPD